MYLSHRTESMAREDLLKHEIDMQVSSSVFSISKTLPLWKGQEAYRLSSQLTEKRVGETVPLAPLVSDEPSAVEARRKTEGSSKDTHQHVTHADVEQDEVDGRPQHLEPCEEEKDEEIADES